MRKLRPRELKEFAQGPKYWIVQVQSFLSKPACPQACVLLLSCVCCPEGQDWDQQVEILSPQNCVYMNAEHGRDCLEVHQCYFFFLDAEEHFMSQLPLQFDWDHMTGF